MYQLAAVGAVAATWVILLGTAVVMGMFMTVIGRDMSYFTHDTNVLWLYVCPSVAAALAFHVWLKNSFFSVSVLSFERLFTLAIEQNVLI